MTVAYPALGETPSVRVGPIDLQPIALLQFDAGGAFDQSRADGQGAGTNVRRTRLGGSAKIADTVTAGFLWDFSGPPGVTTGLYQADLAYSGSLPLVLRAGVYNTPFTLENAQGSGNTLFLENATIVTLVTGLVSGGGRVAGQVGGSGDRWFASVFFAGGKTGPHALSDQRAVLGRVAGLVVQTDRLSVHIGSSAGWLYQVPQAADGSRTLTLSNQPEIQLTKATASLTSGAIPARGARLAGLEAGATWDRLYVQSEAYAITVNGSSGVGRSPTSSGAYLEGSYTLFGTPRQWSKDSAAWALPKPNGGWGAVEIGARFSYVDVERLSGNGVRQGVWSADVNWYPLEPLRVVLEYGHGRVQGGPASRSLDFVALRGQIAF